MLDCHYDWRRVLDVGDVVDVVLMDFTKAFDVVPHSLLLRKLASMGVCQLTLKWLRSFLSGRSQVVDDNSSLSFPGDVSSCVIQGNVIGPVLFTLYINDLPQAFPDCIIKLFSDDAKAYRITKNSLDRILLQLALNALCAWANEWCLILSLQKCLYLQLGYCNGSLSYTLNGHILKPCDAAKDLGVGLQCNLKPGMHCTEIAHKANTRANLIIKSFLSHDPSYFPAPSRCTFDHCLSTVRPFGVLTIRGILTLLKEFNALLLAKYFIYVICLLSAMRIVCYTLAWPAAS